MPAKGSQPAHDESYVLSEGEQQDEIEVTKIDKKGGMVTFSNHGQVQELPLVVGVASGGASPAGGGGAVPGMGNPAAVGQAGAGLPPNNFGGGNRFGRPNPTGLNPSANGSPNAAAGGQPNFGSPGVSANNLNNNPQAEENLAPETKVLLIEAQRLKYKAANSPVADIFPPTPLTQQLNEESGGTGGGGP
jgi:hypothetical protein